ncbi:hypothetical protein FRC08_008562 [Ceratobasidium sp. 394]|nr:hypothetical protein FRC08_008562 [Ceratobasidium sp. 394]
MSFICTNPLCLQTLKTQGAATRHPELSQLGCKDSDIETVKDYTKKLATQSAPQPTPTTTTQAKCRQPAPPVNVAPPPPIPSLLPPKITPHQDLYPLDPDTFAGPIDTDPTPGHIYGSTLNKWESLHEEMKTQYPGNLYAMWKDRKDWQTAEWMATRKVSQSDVDDLLKGDLFEDEPTSFKTAKQLCDKIDAELKCFGTPEWRFTDIELGDAPKDIGLLAHRDIQASADYLMSHPAFSGKLAFASVEKKAEDGITDLYGEPCTGKMWSEWENKESVPKGTTIGSLVFASDKTSLSTHGGDVAAHAVYMTLANLDQETRMKESRVAWILVAIIPVLKWTGTLADNPGLSKTAKPELSGVLNRRLFHRCMSIITRPLRRTSPHDVTDPDGHIRRVLYVLWAYIADLEEQLVIAGLGSKCCPHCQTQSGDLDNPECRHERTSKSILDDIKKVTDTMATLKGGADLETGVEFLHESKKYGLCGIKFPFWATIPGVDIAKVLSIDLLHGFYKSSYQATGPSRRERRI